MISHFGSTLRTPDIKPEGLFTPRAQLAIKHMPSTTEWGKYIVMIAIFSLEDAAVRGGETADRDFEMIGAFCW